MWINKASAALGDLQDNLMTEINATTRETLIYVMESFFLTASQRAEDRAWHLPAIILHSFSFYYTLLNFYYKIYCFLWFPYKHNWNS